MLLKKNFLIKLIIFLLISNTTVAKPTTSFKAGKILEGEVTSIGGVDYQLPEGEWLSLGQRGWFIKGIEYRTSVLVQAEDGVLKALTEIGAMKTAGVYVGLIDSWMQEVFFGYGADGCYQRSEYTLVKRYKFGSAFNCLVINHEDTFKEIYNPDETNQWEKSFSFSMLKVWIEKNDIQIPKTMLTSNHYFYAKRVNNLIITHSYSINPELFGAKKIRFSSEDKSEYHPNNINEFPDAKKFMKSFINNSAIRHIDFETSVRAKKRHKLDLSEYDIKPKKLTSKKQLNLAQEILKLKKLKDEGILTEEEFKKAKKILLK